MPHAATLKNTATGANGNSRPCGVDKTNFTTQYRRLAPIPGKRRLPLSTATRFVPAMVSEETVAPYPRRTAPTLLIVITKRCTGHAFWHRSQGLRSTERLRDSSLIPMCCPNVRLTHQRVRPLVVLCDVTLVSRHRSIAVGQRTHRHGPWCAPARSGHAGAMALALRNTLLA